MGFSVLAGLMIYSPLERLLTSSSHREYYSHILLVPFVSGYLIYSEKKELFAKAKCAFGTGITLIGLGLALFVWKEPGNRT